MIYWKKQKKIRRRERARRMKKIYFDHAATTFPKPDTVSETIYHYIKEQGCNINRGCYNQAYQIEEQVYETRKMVCELFHGEDYKNVIFTRNVTESLNVILKGFLKSGDHVIVSSMEHNAVMRPLVQLEKKGISFSRAICEPDGSLKIERLEECLRNNTKAVIMTHASNVCGTILPIEKVGKFCQKNHLKFIVDSAQTAGILEIDMEKMNIDALAFTGHKGLMGPQGIGGFLVTKEMAQQIEPLITGGTGSISDQEETPIFLPDRFEAGTLNIPGILGLSAGLEWLKKTGMDKIRQKEQMLTKQFLTGLKKIDDDRTKIRIVGKEGIEGRTGVVSIQTKTKEIAQVAYELDERYGIMTRVGLHCAPSAHKTLGTYPIGTIRFSFGFWNTLEEVEFAVHALQEMTEEMRDGI